MNPVRRAGGLAMTTLGAAILLAGCLTSAPTRHYTLQPLAPTGTPTGTLTRTLGVGPLRLPQHLRQAALVRRVSDYRVTYGDFDLWADPLEDRLAEVLVENLARLTGARRVLRFPWRVDEVPDRQISLEITSCEMTPEGDAELSVHWDLRDGRGVLLESGDTSRREPARGEMEALAEALSRALLALSRDLAAAAAR